MGADGHSTLPERGKNFHVVPSNRMKAALVAASEKKSGGYMTSTNLLTWAARLKTIGGAILRYGLVAILLYLGTFKFTVEEAKAIEPWLRIARCFPHARSG
jgi:hypothetical protein